jgi:hypothetical protein
MFVELAKRISLMRRPLTCWLALAGLLLSGTSASAAIIKLGFSRDSRPDMESVGGILSTVADVSLATTGDQNTEVTFVGELGGILSIEGDRASFTLDNVALTGKPVVVGSTVLQETSGGAFSLYDEANTLLLSGTVGDGTLSGPIGGTATSGFLTTKFGIFNGGTLLSLLAEKNLTNASVSISMLNVNGGAGLALSGDGVLNPFTADATALISAQPQVPEPAAATLVATGALALLLARRNRR